MAETLRRGTKARHDELVALLREGVTSVETLSARVGVSVSTVRRDLTHLQQEGRIARTYGGAIVREALQERSFNESEQINRALKSAIASRALELVPERGTVFLDAGTTCLALARLLEQRAPLTVVTRGLEAALLLARTPEVTVVMVGGEVRPLSHGVVGPLSAIALDRLGFDVAFLGTDVVSAEHGPGEPTVEESYVKELAATRAGRVCVLADSSKLSSAHVAAWAKLPPGWTLITDTQADDDIVGTFEAGGVEVHRVEAVA